MAEKGLVSDFPVGWKMVMSTVQGLIVFVGWKMGAPDLVLEIMAGLFGLGTVAKMVTDRVKILSTNGNGKTESSTVTTSTRDTSTTRDTTGASDNRGAS
jgi:hypothetical protein